MHYWEYTSFLLPLSSCSTKKTIGRGSWEGSILVLEDKIVGLKHKTSSKNCLPSHHAASKLANWKKTKSKASKTELHLGWRLILSVKLWYSQLQCICAHWVLCLRSLLLLKLLYFQLCENLSSLWTMSGIDDYCYMPLLYNLPLRKYSDEAEVDLMDSSGACSTKSTYSHCSPVRNMAVCQFFAEHCWLSSNLIAGSIRIKRMSQNSEYYSKQGGVFSASDYD